MTILAEGAKAVGPGGETIAENPKAKKLGEPMGLDEGGRAVYKSDTGLVYDDFTPYTSGKQLNLQPFPATSGNATPSGLTLHKGNDLPGS